MTDFNHAPFFVTVPGTPPRKNERHRTVRIGGRCSRTNGERYLEFIASLNRAIEDDTQAHASPDDPAISDGLWCCTINAYWPQRSKAIGLGTCNADPDAPISCVLDALQACGVIDDDMRVKTVVAHKHYDKKNPRTEITLERLDELK